LNGKEKKTLPVNFLGKGLAGVYAVPNVVMTIEIKAERGNDMGIDTLTA
jgi:hypothetical protein